jgi:ferredoxin-nitrate reductase
MTSEMVLHPGEFGLGRVPARLKPAATTTAVCGFCSTGCGLKIHLNEEGHAINLTADPSYPVNLGMACPKGWEALTPLAATDRATAPLLLDRASGVRRAASWSEALGAFTSRFKGIQQQHGPHSLAFLSTGQIVIEEMALLGALFKFGMGALHCDSNTRQCMATSHVAYKESFGFDAPPYTYADFEESDALIFIGANPCIAHPIMWQRVMMNRRQPEIVVIDPRVTETAQAATQHVALRPKSDLTLLYGLARELILRSAIDRPFLAAHTTGFEAFASFVAEFTPDRVLAETGLSAAAFDRLVRTIAERERVSFWWTMGVNQSHQATRTAQAIINLALMTGNIGRPGTGANSITGQCNAMGSRLFGNATSLLGGYDFKKEADRVRVAGALDLDPARIPAQPGYAYDQIIDAIDRGEIRGLWVIATNTAHSWINQRHARDVLRKLDFLVVQDMYANTETAELADLVLPAAGWGEKDGVLINSERRLGRVKKVARAPGEALSDFAIFKLVADAWGCGDLFRRWESPEATFQLLKEISRGQPCDFTGIRDYAHLDAEGGIQWPYPGGEPAGELRSAECGLRNERETPHTSSELRRRNLPAMVSCEAAKQTPAVSSQTSAEQPRPDPATNEATASAEPRTANPAFRNPHSAVQSSPAAPQSKIENRKSKITERRLFTDGRFYTPDQRARFIFDPPRPMPELPDEAYPFLLLTGRGSSAQWHTGSRTNKSAVLRKLAPTVLTVDIHPTDAKRLGLASGARVRIVSRRGDAEATTVITATVAPGQLFLPMHFETVNRLTFPAFDPHSRQPAYKSCAVTVERL